MQKTPEISNDSIIQLRSTFENILAQENIPENPRLMENFASSYLPLAQWIATQHQQTPLVIGINGSQGSGKSTLSKILSQLLEKGFKKKVAIISIDDLYKTRQQRHEMSENIHPLFQTRGVPGTHDVQLGISIISKLIKQDFPVQIPLFNKVIDDREPEKNWLSIDHKIDIILFEGWCIGAKPQPPTLLTQSINDLEKNKDSDLVWRTFINEQLEKDYQDLFSLIDKLIMLKIPSFNNVLEWRELQENKLKNNSEGIESNHTMSAQELRQFIMHFERITRHSLNEMPDRADVVIEIDNQHQISKTIFKK